MRIEKIELNGFKSFSDRTTIQLHPGITCIVGPNGCGKSNVVDAFRWVLGEQSAKSLRGGSMQEVIFAGSQNKKPKGMAEVSLVVSGLGPGAEGGGDSVTTVTRRLYRSGESDYLLNRQSCRLRDVRDIFLDTGLEVKSFSILEQDRISAILMARPEERRFLIEEVAGVVKYRVRRSEALAKLESSRANLLRITDITGEVKRQISSLDRQARKAERFKALMAELKDIELRLARAAHEALGAELEAILAELGGMREEDALLRAGLSRGEADIEARRIGLAEKDKALEGVKADLRRVEREMAELERAGAVIKSERANLAEYAAKLAFQEEENRAKRAEAEVRRGDVARGVEALRVEAGALAASLEERELVVRAAEQEIANVEAHLESKRRETGRSVEAVNALKNDLARRHASVEAMGGKQASILREQSEAEGHKAAAKTALKETEAAIVERGLRADALREEADALAREAAAMRDCIEALRADGVLAREGLASASSRLLSFKEMVAEVEAHEALEGVRLLAPISDAIKVPKDYERAVESALGELVEGYMVAGMEDVRQAVRVIRERETGRTALMPLEARAAHGPRTLPEGALAWAADVAVPASPEFAPAVMSLLDSVLIVRDIDAALALSAQGVTRVTPEGEVVLPSGAVTAGRGRGILSLKREVRELTDEIERLRTRVDAIAREGDALAGTLRETDSALRAKTAGLQDAEREAGLLKARAERHAEDLERAGLRLEQFRLAHGELTREREGAQALIGEKEREIADQSERIRGIEAEAAALQGEVARRRRAHEDARSQAVECKLSLNSARERIAALDGEGRSIENLLRELIDKEGFILRERAETARRIDEREAQAADKEQALKERALAAGGLNQRISEARDVILAETDQVMESERELKGVRRRIDEAGQRIADLDVRRAEHSMRIGNLRDNIRGSYDVDLASYEAPAPQPEDESRRADLKEKIERLGPVSLGSIEEYDELVKRYDFQMKQQEDLQKSIAELEEAIARINSTTRQRLREAFTALNAKFGEVFVSLFGGGRAELRLTDEDNILETGIEVAAQPPGKRLQNISLLSGGEKTLTALALLFASFLIKPTPLCILDEADAALDETNTGKFSELLKTLSSDIQFIVVTHNRMTMETADFIYGVTMEDPGSSRTISLQMAGA